MRKAQRAITLEENKAKKNLKQRGVQARKAEKARRLFIQQQAPGVYIPVNKLMPIRDPEKNPTPLETEALRANPSLYDRLAQATRDRDKVYYEDPKEVSNVLIDPAVLNYEQGYQKEQRRGLKSVVIPIEESSEEGTDDEGSNSDSSLPRSVGSIDSITRNADFVALDNY